MKLPNLVVSRSSFFLPTSLFSSVLFFHFLSLFFLPSLASFFLCPFFHNYIPYLILLPGILITNLPFFIHCSIHPCHSLSFHSFVFPIFFIVTFIFSSSLPPLILPLLPLPTFLLYNLLSSLFIFPSHEHLSLSLYLLSAFIPQVPFTTSPHFYFTTLHRAFSLPIFPFF